MNTKNTLLTATLLLSSIAFSFAQWSPSTTSISDDIGRSGRVGVGTTAPSSNSLLHISSSWDNNGTRAPLMIQSDNGSKIMLLDGNEIDGLTSLYLNHNSDKNIMLATGGGNVGIGTTSPNNKLDVKGTIRAEEVIVSTGWSDFVFEKDYNLKSLEEVKSFIDKNGHLPEIPSADDVETNGVKIGEVESKLLMKIEELTLYLIEQNQRIKELEGLVKDSNK